jgi:hypothetical protein
MRVLIHSTAIQYSRAHGLNEITVTLEAGMMDD